jgi:hypothetical protein
MYVLLVGWPDWANFCPWATVYYEQFFNTEVTQTFVRIFSHANSCVSFNKKSVGRHFGQFFHKLLWSPRLLVLSKFLFPRKKHSFNVNATLALSIWSISLFPAKISESFCKKWKCRKQRTEIKNGASIFPSLQSINFGETHYNKRRPSIV